MGKKKHMTYHNWWKKNGINDLYFFLVKYIYVALLFGQIYARACVCCSLILFVWPLKQFGCYKKVWQKVKVRVHFNEGCAGIPEKRKLLLVLGLPSNFVFNPKHFIEIVNFVFERE